MAETTCQAWQCLDDATWEVKHEDGTRRRACDKHLADQSDRFGENRITYVGPNRERDEDPPEFEPDAKAATLAVYPGAYALHLPTIDLWQIWGGMGDEFPEPLAEGGPTEQDAWEVAALHAEIDQQAR